MRLVYSRLNHSQISHDQLTTRIRATGPSPAQNSERGRASEKCRKKAGRFPTSDSAAGVRGFRNITHH
ncbi:unnamed protein product [Arctogadus glacialis]